MNKNDDNCVEVHCIVYVARILFQISDFIFILNIFLSHRNSVKIEKQLYFVSSDRAYLSVATIDISVCL